MTFVDVVFTFHSGLRRRHFGNVRLTGGWDASGLPASDWAEVPMAPVSDGSGCDAFVARVAFDAAAIGTTFRWGVVADLAGAPDTWVITTETGDPNSSDASRSFVLAADPLPQDYWFSIGRLMGAQKWTPPGATRPGIRFTAWAPNAGTVSVVFAPPFAEGARPSGYVADDGDGLDLSAPRIPLRPTAGGLWVSDLTLPPPLDDFAAFLGRPYMFEVVNEQGATTYKVDIFSRDQIGRGDLDPAGSHYAGTYLDLDGLVSCSRVADPDLVANDVGDTALQKQTLIPSEDFWSSEFTSGLDLPQRVEDLVIYEMHIGSLGYPSTAPGTLVEAMNYVDQLADLGVNAVELMPMLEFDGDLQWGYGTSLFFCLQTSAGGANDLKHFVRACHQRGIAVILDVVYNHFSSSGGERTEWGYDSDPVAAPQNNIWYWYEGVPEDYPGKPSGGYLDNGSSGFTPRFWDETVRQTFTSSAATLFDDFHIDGLRVDLTDAIHQDNALHANGAPVGAANQFGAKFLRELGRTIRIVRPQAFMIAEDYTEWAAVTEPVAQGGFGFDAVWDMDFYHHLIGDGDSGDGYARLLKTAGLGEPGPLRMDWFAGALLATADRKVAYHESHDEAGNEALTERTIVTAVNGAPLIGETRRYAEARCRFVAGMAALSAGTPMIFMGEEIGAAKPFTFDAFAWNKEDLVGGRTGDGRFLFRFYRDLVGFVRASPAAKSRSLDVIHVHNDNRVLAFVLGEAEPGRQSLLVAASLNDVPFADGYVITTDPSRLSSGSWREVFNSDSAFYGGDNVGNAGGVMQAYRGEIDVVIPAHGFIVLEAMA